MQPSDPDLLCTCSAAPDTTSLKKPSSCPGPASARAGLPGPMVAPRSRIHSDSFLIASTRFRYLHNILRHNPEKLKQPDSNTIPCKAGCSLLIAVLNKIANFQLTSHPRNKCLRLFSTCHLDCGCLDSTHVNTRKRYLGGTRSPQVSRRSPQTRHPTASSSPAEYTTAQYSTVHMAPRRTAPCN